jgi:hypothetical protein
VDNNRSSDTSGVVAIEENNLKLYSPEGGLLYKFLSAIRWVREGTGAVANLF